jgi:hypothetical protein
LFSIFKHLHAFDQQNIALKIEPQSSLTFQVAAWGPLAPNLASLHLPPSKITLDAWEEVDTDDDEDDDPEAQYITIYPGSPFHKPAHASHWTSADSTSNSESSSPSISPSISALPSDSFLQISPVSPASPRTLRVLYCQEFSRAVRTDPAIEFDETYLETMEDTLLLEPQKAFERVCIASLWRDSSRHPVDVPVDLSDDDDEWELWDSVSCSIFLWFRRDL